MTSGESKMYAMKDIKEESKERKRNLLVIHDKVYDVTSFLNEHPGGEEVLIDRKGTNASEEFDDVGHSEDAIKLMAKYRVGEIVPEERTNQKPKAGWVAGYDPSAKGSTKYVSGPGLPVVFLVTAVIALNLALWLYNR